MFIADACGYFSMQLRIKWQTIVCPNTVSEYGYGILNLTRQLCQLGIIFLVTY